MDGMDRDVFDLVGSKFVDDVYDSTRKKFLSKLSKQPFRSSTFHRW